MTENDKLVSKLEERSENQAERIDKLEKNQLWGVLTILGLVLKQAFDFTTGGGR